MSLNLVVANTNATSYVSDWRVEKSGVSEITSLTLIDRTTPGANAYTTTLGDTYRMSMSSNTILLSGGEIASLEISHMPKGSGTVGGTKTRVTGKGWEALPSQIMVDSLTISANTIRDTAYSLFNTYLAGRGCTFTSANTGGYEHPAMTFEYVPLSQVFDALTQVTGCGFRINGDKAFAVVLPGELTGPDLTSNNVMIDGWKITQSRVRRATRVYARAAIANTETYVSSVEGNGTLTIFPLRVLPQANALPTQVVEGANTYTIGSGTWSWDATQSAIVRSPALANTQVATVSYAADSNTWLRVWDVSVTQNSLGGFITSACVDTTVDLSDQPTLVQALSWLDAELSKRTSQPRQLTLKVNSADYYPLMQCSVTLPWANVSGNWLIQSVVQEAKAHFPDVVTSTLTLLEGDAWDPNLWFRFFRTGGVSGSGSYTVGAGGGSTGGGTTVVPIRLALGGSNVEQVADTASAYVDGPEAIPLVSSAYLAGTYTLRTYAMVRNANTNIAVDVWNVTSNTSAGSTNTNSTSFATGTASVTLDSSSTYLLKVKVTGGSAGICGNCTLDAN